MGVEGSEKSIPFRYEARKVGYGISVALEAKRSGGQKSLSPSADSYFYRRAALTDSPVFVVAFGPDVVNYRRSDDSDCPS
jgi:hypothetical protein